MTARPTARAAAIAAAALVGLVAACGRNTDGRTAAVADTARPAALAPRPAPDSEPLRVPSDSTIPSGDLGVAIRRGRALVLDAHDSLPSHAPSPAIRCQSCHLNDGTRAGAVPWPGVYARFPQYRSRSGDVIRIEDRVNNCFTRSMNGRALDVASRDMRDIVAYLAWLSRGYRIGGTVAGQGLRKISAPHAPAGDTAAGRAIYVASCERCHGAGQGTAVAPALWGSRSYNRGASLAQIRSAAGFIRYNMPYDRPGTLTDSQAFDVAAYVNAHERASFAGSARDWPKGDAPDDAPNRASPPPAPARH